MNKKIIITLPYSFNYRNIVLTGVLKELLNKGNNIYLFLPEALLHEKLLKALEVQYQDQLFVDKLVRPLKFSFANLLFTLMAGVILSIQNSYSCRIKKISFFRTDKKNFFKFFLLPVLIPKNNFFLSQLIKIFIFSLNDTGINEKLKEINPDIFFFTFTHKINEYYYFNYAIKNRIKTISLVHSWDVITTKGSFIYAPDKVMVWNRINEHEYEFFVNKLLKHNSVIVKVGIPQFDIYSKKLKNINIEKIKNQLQIPLDKDIIVYTSSVRSLFPNEKLLIETLIRDFENNIFKNKFLYIRLHPQEALVHYNEIELSGNNYKIHIPDTNNSNIEDNVKFSEDTLLKLFNDLIVADLVINMASSITLDATALQKKVLNIAFDHVSDPNYDFPISVDRYYYRDHMSKIMNSNEIDMVKSYNSLVDYIESYKNTNDYAKNLKNSFIYDFGNSINLIANEVLK